MNEAAEYLRSSREDPLSIENQARNNRAWAKRNNVKIIATFIDDGKSGASMDGRDGALEMLAECPSAEWQMVLCNTLDRFGRELEESLANGRIIKSYGKRLFFTVEGVEFKSNDEDGDNLTVHVRAAVAESERKRILWRTRQGKKAKLEKGEFEALGISPPFGRIYDKESKRFILDEEKTEKIKWVAKQFLADVPLRELATALRQEGFSMSYNNLLTILRGRCDTEWTVKLHLNKPKPKRKRGRPRSDAEPVEKPKVIAQHTFKVPELLDPETIKAVKERLSANRTNNRHHDPKVRHYALRGYLFCDICGKGFTGQVQRDKYHYYLHSYGKKKMTCPNGRGIPLPKLEASVFTTIFENTMDQVGFRKALNDSFPDVKHINKLRNVISTSKKDLKKIAGQKENLIEAVADGIMDKNDIKQKMDQLKERESEINKEMESTQEKLNDLPNPEQFKRNAERVRLGIQDYFGGEKRLAEMAYQEKRDLLDWLFPVGVDEDGERYGIFLKKNGGGWEYYINAKVFAGLRNLDDQEYKTKNPGYAGHGCICS